MESSEPTPELTSDLSNYDGSVIKVDFPDGSSERFHVTWLRDSCQCEQCISPLTKDKKLNPADIDFKNLKPLKIVNNGSELLIDWYDGSPHHSCYKLSWLMLFKGKFGESSEPQDGVYAPKEIVGEFPWNVSIINPIYDHHYSFESIMTDDSTLESLLKDILSYGIAFVSGAPTEKETVLSIARRIAYERISGYGSTFDVVVNPSPDAHFSYSSNPLELHTDLCYRERVPGIQMLHCIKAAVNGGDSYFADGLYCCQQLQKFQPEMFEILTKPVMFSFFDSQRGIWFRQKWPVIVTEPGDQNSVIIKEVNLSYFSMRAPLLPHDQMESFFTAFKQLFSYTRCTSNRLSCKLKDGDVVIFNNRRVFHGREGYDSLKEKRFLQGCYMDLDEIQGLYEKLSTKSG